MDGLDLARRAYARLRKPSQASLPWQVVLDTTNEVISRRRLDLALSDQNQTAIKSEWFTPTSADFPLSSIGLDVLLPVRLEMREVGSERETGEGVPIVNYDVLNNSIVGGVSFYGDPIRMAFRDTVEVVGNRQYRLIYEQDFDSDSGLDTVSGLPEFFRGFVSLEVAYRLLDVVEDSTPEWKEFFAMVSGRWELQLAKEEPAWSKFVRMFRGRAQIPKRTFWQNQRCAPRAKYFRD